MRNFIAILALAAFITMSTGCVSKEAKITGNVGSYIGYVGENQTNFQTIYWTATIANTGDKPAKNTRADVVLYPAVVSRLINIKESTVPLGDLESEDRAGFKGNATFNATGLSKQDIAAWEPLVKIKVTWTEDGKVIEKVLPEASK